MATTGVGTRDQVSIPVLGASGGLTTVAIRLATRETVEIWHGMRLLASIDRGAINAWLDEPSEMMDGGEVSFFYHALTGVVTIVVPGGAGGIPADDLAKLRELVRGPMAVWFFGGRAHRWTGVVPARIDSVNVVMVDGRAHVQPDQDDPFSGAVTGKSEAYQKLPGVGPDSKGRLAFRCTTPLAVGSPNPTEPGPTTEPASEHLARLLDDVSAPPQLTGLALADWWAKVEDLLGERTTGQTA